MIKLRKDKPICPKCNGIIIEKENSWVCSNKIKKNHCNFEMPNHRDGKKLDISMLINYQNCEGNDKISKLAIDIFNEKKNIKMKNLNLNNEQLELFENGTIIAFRCPHCTKRNLSSGPRNIIQDGQIYQYNDMLQCINFPTGKCNFKVEDNYNGIKFNKKELKKIMSGFISSINTFINPLTNEKEKGRVFFDVEHLSDKYPKIDVIPKYLFFKDLDDFKNKYSSNTDKFNMYLDNVRITTSDGKTYTMRNVLNNNINI